MDLLFIFDHSIQICVHGLLSNISDVVVKRSKVDQWKLGTEKKFNITNL